MKIRMYSAAGDAEKTIWLPTGFLFSKAGMYLMSKGISRQSRKEYEEKLEQVWKSHTDTAVDDLLPLEDVQAAERLEPPITQEQAMELFTALKNSKYLLHGLPLVSIDHADGDRVRIDL